MLRFFTGLGLGTLLVIYSLGFLGVGHGTAAPLVLVAFYMVWAPGPAALLAAPFIWAIYFQLIPKLRGRLKRVIVVVILLLAHLLAGLWTGIHDPAFARSLAHERSGLIGFGLLFAVTAGLLMFFSLRGVRGAIENRPSF